MHASGLAFSGAIDTDDAGEEGAGCVDVDDADDNSDSDVGDVEDVKVDVGAATDEGEGAARAVGEVDGGATAATGNEDVDDDDDGYDDDDVLKFALALIRSALVENAEAC